MTENVENMIFEILKKIQADNASFRDEVSSRFERLEDLARKQRRDTAGMLVMAKSVAGTFVEDLAAVEARVAALEANRN